MHEGDRLLARDGMEEGDANGERLVMTVQEASVAWDLAGVAYELARRGRNPSLRLGRRPTRLLIEMVEKAEGTPVGQRRSS